MKYLFRPEFRLPLVVFALLLLGLVPELTFFSLVAVVIGLVKIINDSIKKIRAGALSLDYIALLAMAVSIPSHEWLAGSVVALMITGGEALDVYASRRAESALRALLEKIPKTCVVKEKDGALHEIPIQEVKNGAVIVLRSNELIPLDGTLLSAVAEINEANLTGEVLPVVFEKGSFLKSGAVNVGTTIELLVEGSFASSTYMKIVHLVDEAKSHPSRTVHLAETFNFPFTAITLLLAGAAWYVSGDIARALAVLVIATPCPLLIAAPIAFIGGLSRAARHNIIIKRPVTLEALTSAKKIFFDKTGTLTLGEPRLLEIEAHAQKSKDELLAIASAIEFHSIHPLARALQHESGKRHSAPLEAKKVQETIGQGIAGEVGGARYRIGKSTRHREGDILLGIFEGDAEIGTLYFEDILKDAVGEMFHSISSRGLKIEMLTGDRAENAERLFGAFGITIRSSQTPETKFKAIEAGKRDGGVIMVGDGLNDAPALAKADVGIVFSGTENSAAIDAADVVILSRDVILVPRLLEIGARSKRIALESISVGIGLSIVGMLFAAFGFIPPVIGALLQEGIDIAVIFNSLRAALD